MKSARKSLSLLLSFILILSCLAVPTSLGSAENRVVSSLNFNILSDIHYYPAEYTGDYCPEWEEQVLMAAKEFDQIPGLLDAALESIAASSSLPYAMIILSKFIIIDN